MPRRAPMATACVRSLVGNIAVAVSSSQLTKNFHFASGERFVAATFRQVGCGFGWNLFLPSMD